MEANNDSNLRQFLADRRISISDLSKKVKDENEETAAQRTKRQREFAI